MARHIAHEITIDAAPATVWRILTDLPGHREWNPHFRRIAGELREGGRLEVTFLDSDGTDGMTFRPRVLVVEAERELRWKGKLGVRGIFDGEHRFVIEPNGNGGVTFTNAERFSGVLVPFLGKVLAETADNFAAFNEALAARAEAADRLPCG